MSFSKTGPTYEFQDLAQPTVKLQLIHGGSKWRTTMHGLNLEGHCENKSCAAYKKSRVVIKWGYRSFNFYLNDNEDDCKCPLCGKYVTPISCGFVNTYWRYKGYKKVEKGKRPIFETGRWQFADAGEYTTFKDTNMVTWRDLKIEVMDPKEMTSCLEVFSSIHDGLESAKENFKINDEKIELDKMF